MRSFKHQGALMRNTRRSLDMSQSELGRALSKEIKNPGQFISNCERGLCHWPLKRVAILCEVLKISHMDFKSETIKDYTLDLDFYLGDEKNG
jgi:hypothetical protein